MSVIDGYPEGYKPGPRWVSDDGVNWTLLEEPEPAPHLGTYRVVAVDPDSGVITVEPVEKV